MSQMTRSRRALRPSDVLCAHTSCLSSVSPRALGLLPYLSPCKQITQACIYLFELVSLGFFFLFFFFCFFGKYRAVRLPGHMAALRSTLHGGRPTCVPPSSAGGLLTPYLFPTSSPVVSWAVDCSHSDGCGVIPHFLRFAFSC